jgi:hypothetical protein
MQELLFTFHSSAIASLAAVRCIAGLEAAADGDTIWLRGMGHHAAVIDKSLQELPVKARYLADGQNRLFLPGGRTPVALLKETPWQPLTTFIPVEAPISALPGVAGPRIDIRLVPSAKAREGAALLTTLAAWKAYAETAPTPRLLRLRFAVSAANEVLLTGHPLPPLPGREYWLNEGILLPSGYDFEIPVAAVFIAAKLNPHKDGFILFNTDGSWQKADNHFFVEARRSAVRLTNGNDPARANT